MQKIMLVEDNREISGPLMNLLKVKGFMTLLCEGGDQVIEEVKRFQPDLLLLDIKLPGEDGFDICQKVRQFSQLPVIFMSAVVGTDTHIKAFKLGADDFLDKPFCMSELLLRINAVLKRSRD